MKYAFLGAGLLALVAICASNATAQENAASSEAAANSSLEAVEGSDSAAPVFASVTLVPATDLPAITSEANAIAEPSDPPASQVTVFNVHPAYNFQLYGGYTFVRFYAFPAREVNRNGFDLSMSYFFRKGLLGVEGALTTTFGTVGNNRSDFVFAGGGPRVRWSAPRGLELWAHGLIGGANFGPSISGYGQSALAYELGGGVDITAHFRRLAYRVEGDMIGTRLYNTTQYSPKFSVGLVFKF